MTKAQNRPALGLSLTFWILNFGHSDLFRISIFLFRVSGFRFSIFVFRLSVFCLFTFTFLLAFWPGAKKRPPIIGRTCAFDAKIYKNVDAVFPVSDCGGGNKKSFKLFYFCSALPTLLVEFLEKILPILTWFPGIGVAEFGGSGGFCGDDFSGFAGTANDICGFPGRDQLAVIVDWLVVIDNWVFGAATCAREMDMAGIIKGVRYFFWGMNS